MPLSFKVDVPFEIRLMVSSVRCREGFFVPKIMAFENA